MGKVKNAQLVLTRRVCRTYVHIGKWPPGASRPNSRQRFQTPSLLNQSRIQDIRSANYQYCIQLTQLKLNCDVQLLCNSDGEASIAPASGGYLIYL